MKQYIGVELLEPIRDGHDGTIGGYQYFTAPLGYGLHVELTSVIRKLSAAEIFLSLKEVLSFFKSKMSEHLQAVHDRDDYIDHLKSKIERMKSRPCSARPSFKELEHQQDELLSAMTSKVLYPAHSGTTTSSGGGQNGHDLGHDNMMMDDSSSPHNAGRRKKQLSFVHPHPLSPITPMSPSRNSFRYSTPIRHSQSIRNSQRLLRHRHFRNMESAGSSASNSSSNSSSSSSSSSSRSRSCSTETTSTATTSASEYTSSPSHRMMMDRNSSSIRGGQHSDDISGHSFGGLAPRKSTLPVIADVRESFSSQSRSTKRDRDTPGNAKQSIVTRQDNIMQSIVEENPEVMDDRDGNEDGLQIVNPDYFNRIESPLDEEGIILSNTHHSRQSSVSSSRSMTYDESSSPTSCSSSSSSSSSELSYSHSEQFQSDDEIPPLHTFDINTKHGVEAMDGAVLALPSNLNVSMLSEDSNRSGHSNLAPFQFELQQEESGKDKVSLNSKPMMRLSHSMNAIRPSLLMTSSAVPSSQNTVPKPSQIATESAGAEVRCAISRMMRLSLSRTKSAGASSGSNTSNSNSNSNSDSNTPSLSRRVSRFATPRPSTLEALPDQSLMSPVERKSSLLKGIRIKKKKNKKMMKMQRSSSSSLSFRRPSLPNAISTTMTTTFSSKVVPQEKDDLVKRRSLNLSASTKSNFNINSPILQQSRHSNAEIRPLTPLRTSLSSQTLYHRNTNTRRSMSDSRTSVRGRGRRMTMLYSPIRDVEMSPSPITPFQREHEFKQRLSTDDAMKMKKQRRSTAQSLSSRISVSMFHKESDGGSEEKQNEVQAVDSNDAKDAIPMTMSKMKGLSQFEALAQVRKEHMLNPERSPSASASIFSPSTDWTESSSDDSSGSEDEGGDSDSEKTSDDGSDLEECNGFIASTQYEVEDTL